MTLHVLYRGPLSSCNYACAYCPFAKKKESRRELTRDRDALERFTGWVEARGAATSVFFTPWGEALIRRAYREAIVRLSHVVHVERVAVQTNLSYDVSFFSQARVDRVALWATFHPTEIDYTAFARKVLAVRALGVRISVGVVALDAHLDAARALRSELPDDVYMWINAAKRTHGVYDEARMREWSAIDPLFAINTQRHTSQGLPCFTGHDTIAVDGDGDARRCHFDARPLGNLYDGTLALDPSPRACDQQNCGCHIGYVHLEPLGLRAVFEDGLLERIPKRPLAVLRVAAIGGDVMRVKLREALGVLPVPDRMREAWLALAGDAHLPRTKFDATSLPLLMPRFSIPLWRGALPIARKVLVTNLFNHKQTPIADGWSVRRTQIEDFRRRDLTYDSHNGTDLAIPPGTRVVAPAPGRVVRISTEFHRGGLKLLIDHGDNLLTSYAHLSRTIARVGDVVTRGQIVALSGMSGLDGLTFFPWLPPHVHWNVYLDGAYVDPFAREGTDEAPIFRGGRGVRAARVDRQTTAASRFDHGAVLRVIESARSPSLRARLASIGDPHLRACDLFMERSYFPSVFTDHTPLFETRAARASRLDLPFSPADFDGIALADEV